MKRVAHASESGPKPIAIEALRHVAGVSTGMLQPSVVVVLRFQDNLPSHLCQQIDAIFPGTPKLERAEKGTLRNYELARKIGDVVTHLLKQQGMPIFATALIARLDPAAYCVSIPSVTGLHDLTRALVSEVVNAANDAMKSSLPGAPTERFRTLTQAVRRQAPRGKNTLPMLVAAHRLGIPWDRLHGNIYQFGYGARARWFDSSISDRTSSIAVQLAKNKQATAAVLRRHWLPVPRHQPVRSEDEALSVAEAMGFPVVVKPANLDRGVGVATRLRDAESVRRAYQAARRHSEQILLEEHVEGKDHRLHVLEGEVYRVRHRIPGGVTGDGISTVEQLLDALNADPRRGLPGSSSELIRIDLDDEALTLLREQAREAASVPATGEFVQLRRIANVSVGGVSMPVRLEDVHPDNIELAVRAVAALKLDLAAVDLLIPDIRRSWVDGGAAICEVNAQPQFGSDAPEWIFGRYFQAQGRIPIVMVVGECPDGGWVDQLRSRVQESGTRMGYCDRAGTHVGKDLVPSAQAMSVFQGCRFLIEDHRIEAILAIADSSLLEHGLPTDRFDALVLTDAGGVTDFERLAPFVARHATRVFCDTSTQSWLAVRQTLKCEGCIEASQGDIVDQLGRLLSGSSLASRLPPER